jgi:two-component system, LytTR family, sensor histidine kinase AlgZ
VHPVIRGGRLSLYLLAWLPLTYALSWLLAAYGKLSWRTSTAVAVPACLVYVLICLSAWYPCRALRPQTAALSRIVRTHLATAVMAAALWMGVVAAIHAALPVTGSITPALPAVFAMGFVLYLLAVALYYVVLAVEAARQAEAREAEAYVLAGKAELRALKAQINPHFLYNSLNSISALTSVDPGKAREMCVQLAAFLRSTLGMGEKAAIPFSEELALTRGYLNIERIRFGARLAVEEEIGPECVAFPVPPLLLQPLVENAIVHGIANLVDPGFVRISAHWVPASDGRPEEMRIAVENSFDPQAGHSRQTGGFGLASVRKRIQTYYGAAAAIQATPSEDVYRVEVRLPATGVGAKG